MQDSVYLQTSLHILQYICMQLPVLKSITDVRRDTKAILNEVKKKKDENESLWEELVMIRSKELTKKERSYPLRTVVSGKI